MDFVTVPKGRGCKYVCGGFIFDQYAHKKGKIYLKCSTSDCTARGMILDNKIVLKQNHSYHETHTSEIDKLKLVETCRKRAAETDTETLRQIFDEETRNSSTAVSEAVSYVDIQSSMYKRRRLQLPSLPAEPTEAEDCILGTRFERLNNSQFFRGSVSVDQQGSAILFASDDQLQLLRIHGSFVYIDATFKTVPRLFFQLFTVFVCIDCFTFPAFFSLMTRKTTELYTAIMTKIHELVPDFSPNDVMADFEDASVASFRSVFGDSINIHGCWFHYSQAIVKCAKKLGLTHEFRNNDVSQRCIKALTCLSLLPENDMETAVGEIEGLCLQSSPDTVPKLQRLCKYVKRQWLQKATIGPSRLSVRNCDHRTNNGVESFHSTFRRRVQVAHPNLFAFLTRLQVGVIIFGYSFITKVRFLSLHMKNVNSHVM